MNKPKPPTQPRVRVLHDVSASLEVVPYFLEGEGDIIEEARRIGRIHELLEDPSFFAVGVGHLKLRHYLDYERVYGEPLDNAVNKLLWVFWALNKQINPKMDEMDVPEIKAKDGKIETPFGDLVGSLQYNLADLLGFALSRLGRIIGKETDTTYKFEPVEPAEVIDLLDANSLMKVDEEDNTPLFFEILELTGLYNPKLAKAVPAPTEEGESEDDGPKNKKRSRSRNKDDSSTKE